jgi:tetrapyrrole methylase family protein/MazG family protein
MADVIQGIHRKIVRRHPHVFGNIEVDGVGGVLANWETLKAAERSEKNAIRPKGILDGVPGVLPSLAQAQEIQDRAARVGFDWPEVNGVLEKIQEEIQEVLEAPDERALEGEVGDLLFAAVNLARWKKVDAEAALRETNQKFRRRFRYIETHAREDGRDLRAMTLEEMDRYWDAAKAEE